MGYYVTLTGSDFVIPAAKLYECYVALCDLNKRDELKTGGSYGPDGQTAKWFAWMPENYPDELKTTGEILETLGFECENCTNGDLAVIHYASKCGNEDVFIDVCGQFVADGSYMEWRGEDGEIWRTEWRKGEAANLRANITWVPC